GEIDGVGGEGARIQGGGRYPPGTSVPGGDRVALQKAVVQRAIRRPTSALISKIGSKGTVIERAASRPAAIVSGVAAQGAVVQCRALGPSAVGGRIAAQDTVG